MKHEFMLAAVVVVGVGSVAGTILVGSRVGESPVVSNPYEAGLHHQDAVARRAMNAPAAPAATGACDLARAPCTQPAGPLEVRFDLAPRPLRTMTELAAAVELREAGASVDGRAVAVSFQMRGMNMGENRSDLAPVGGGRYAGKAVLVRCPSGRKDWIATVVVGPPAEAVVARFEFTVAE
jgi:nitrogen fixation protein FixH